MHDEYLKISQFIDNELDKDQSLFLMQQLAKKQELDKKFRRYEVISQAMKTEVFLPLTADFVKKVSREIKNEPAHFRPGKKRYKQIVFNLTALAASVAVVAVIFMRGDYFSIGDTQPALAVVENNAAGSAQVEKNADEAADTQLAKTEVDDNKSFAMVAGSRSIQKTAPDYAFRVQPVDPKFNDYLQAHSGNLYSSGSNFQAYTQVVGYGRE